MAIEKQNRSEKPVPEGGLTQKRRWLVFGSNVAVAVLLAAALMVVAVWLSGSLLKGRARSDWTVGGRFSLSPRSKALVADLPCPVTITNLYSHTPEIPASEEQWERVQDLLTEYGHASSNITVEAVNPGVDVGGVETLVARLKKRYEKDLAKPKAVVESFTALRKDLSDLLTAQAKRLDDAAKAWKDGPQEAVVALRTVAQGWRELKGVGDQTAAAIQVLTDQSLPAYSTAVTRAKDYLKIVNDNMGAVPAFYGQVQEAAKGAPVPDEVKTILATGKETYEAMRKRIDAFAKQAADLPELELDSVRREIGQGEVILVETPDKVKVVSFDDVWVRNPARNEDREESEERLFNGESAVSSALLGLCNKDKPAVFFVTFGSPASGYGGPYAGVAERLTKSNFIVEDWDLMRSPEMPKPEHVTKAILVLMPPPPPNMQQPMPPPTPEAYRPALDAIKGGAPAIILGEPGTMFSPTVPYSELFETFGAKPRFDTVAVHKVVVDATSGREKAVPQVEITSYPPDHPITRPMDGLPTMMLTASILELAKQMPEGVAVTPILELPGGPDYWGETAMMEAVRGESKFKEGEDLRGPLPLAVAATRKLKEGEQKAVLFGDADFAQDRVAFYRDIFGREMFPGNAELFVNSVLWVSGTEHLITVSPEALQARRIGDLGSWALPVQIGLIGGLPLAVLVVGIIVYVIRRR